MVVNFYADAYFSGMWGQEDLQDTVYDKSRTRLWIFLQFSYIVGVKDTYRDLYLYSTL